MTYKPAEHKGNPKVVGNYRTINDKTFPLLALTHVTALPWMLIILAVKPQVFLSRTMPCHMNLCETLWRLTVARWHFLPCLFFLCFFKQWLIQKRECQHWFHLPVAATSPNSSPTRARSVTPTDLADNKDHTKWENGSPQPRTDGGW